MTAVGRKSRPFETSDVMALPQNTKVIVRRFRQKRKSKFDDDNNFHVIIAPGVVKHSRCRNLMHNHLSFVFQFSFWRSFSAYFPSLGFLRETLKTLGLIGRRFGSCIHHFGSQVL